jgi:hypothetical protein
MYPIRHGKKWNKDEHKKKDSREAECCVNHFLFRDQVHKVTGDERALY